MFDVLEQQTRLARNQWKITVAAFWLLGFETKGRSIEEIDSHRARRSSVRAIGPWKPALPR